MLPAVEVGCAVCSTAKQKKRKQAGKLVVYHHKHKHRYAVAGPHDGKLSEQLCSCLRRRERTLLLVRKGTNCRVQTMREGRKVCVCGGGGGGIGALTRKIVGDAQ